MSKLQKMQAVDIFSLGVVLYDTISSGRQRLFKGRTFNEVLFYNENFTGLNKPHHIFIRSFLGEGYLYLLNSMLKLN